MEVGEDVDTVQVAVPDDDLDDSVGEIAHRRFLKPIVNDGNLANYYKLTSKCNLLSKCQNIVLQYLISLTKSLTLHTSIIFLIFF